ncbi:MAG: hypothetical protein IIA59_02460 [Candidatus Marinimicrobia bacterium]|nr:hypothetical protein [Candidatus Neomarinimicrobiota bacterium]
MQEGFVELVKRIIFEAIWPFLIEFGLFGTVLALAGAMAFALLFLRLFAKKSPPWTIIKNITKLRINDAAAKTATALKELTLSANANGIKHYIHRNISSDGEDDIEFELEPRVKLINHEIHAHEHIITIEFPGGINRFEQESTWIKMTVKNSFPNNSEALATKVDQPTFEIGMEIEFPPDRLPIENSLCVVHIDSGMEKVIAKLKLQDHTVKWSLSRKRFRLPIRSSRLEILLFALQPGAYELRWDW